MGVAAQSGRSHMGPEVGHSVPYTGLCVHAVKSQVHGKEGLLLRAPPHLQQGAT